MLSEFYDGFFLAAGFVSWLAGCFAAVLLFFLLAVFVAVIFSWLFDGSTRLVARRIRKKKRKPRNRLEEIILERDDAV